MVKVLDFGSIELIDSLGHDMTPVLAARVSTSTGPGGPQAKGSDRDIRLLNYLMQHRHTSPFEMIELVWRVKAPVFIARQWMRHRTASYNEFSQRYAEIETLEFYKPAHARLGIKQNKQSSIMAPDAADIQDLISDSVDELTEVATRRYREMLDAGVARELARIVLPSTVYTQFWYKSDMHNTLHFLKLRSAEDAQWEIQQYAKAMISTLDERFPLIMDAWRNSWPQDKSSSQSEV